MFERGGSVVRGRIFGIGHEERAFERGDRGFDAFQGAVIGGAKTGPGGRAQGGDNVNLVPDGIENHHERRAQHDGIGNPDRIWLWLGEALHLTDHVVAEIAEDAGRHGGEIIGRIDMRFGDQCAQGGQRRTGARREIPGIREGVAIDLRPPLKDPPDDVGIKANH